MRLRREKTVVGGVVGLPGNMSLRPCEDGLRL